MAIYFPTTGTPNLTRTPAITLSGNFTVTFWTNYADTPSGGLSRTSWVIGDNTYALPYIWVGSKVNASNTLLEVFDGSTYYDTPIQTVTNGSWVFHAVTYNATTHIFTYYVNGTVVGTLTVNINALSFTANDQMADDPGGTWENFSIGFRRDWNATLTAGQLATEQTSAIAVDSTGLQADTPLLSKTNLADRIGSNNWTLNGTGASYVNPPFAAPIKSFVGSFAKRSGTGAQVVSGLVDNLGNAFTPKVIFFFGSDQTGTGFTDAANPNVPCGSLQTGFDDGTTAGSMTITCQDDAQNGGALVERDSFGLIGASITRLQSYAFNRDQASGHVSAMASGQFTFNWDFGNDSGYLSHYIAFGGDTLVAKVQNILHTPASGTQAYTGIGFQPTATIFIPELNAATGGVAGRRMIGFAASHPSCPQPQASMSSASVNNVDPTESAHIQLSTRAIVRLDYSAGVPFIAESASLVSFDPDGFTLNWDNNGVNQTSWWALCMGGVGADVGTFLQLGSNGSQTVSGLQTSPTALILASTGAASSATSGVTLQQSVGATDGTRQGSNWMNDNNGASPSQSSRYHTDSYTVVTASGNDPAALTGALAFASFGSHQFVGTWSNCDGSRREVVYLALGGSLVTPVANPCTPYVPTPPVIMKTINSWFLHRFDIKQRPEETS